MPRPLVAFVGRPNVGKSTLFNRVAGRHLAITEDTPGVTRDRHYADGEWNDRSFALVDTGGFLVKSDEPLIHAVRQQAQIAIEEAAVIVFVVDGMEGMTSADHDLATQLRRSGKPILLAVNKIDGERREAEGNLSEFYRLGFEGTHPVSAEHGRGVGELLDDVVKRLPAGPPAEDINRDTTSIRLAVVGRPNVGKSTFLNKLLGEERFVASALPGTTRDAVDATLEYGGRKFILTDTAGMRKKRMIVDRVEQFSVLRAMKRVEDSDVAAVLIDATELGAQQDAAIAGLAEEKGRALILVVNKWDLIAKTPDAAAKHLEELRLQLKFLSYAPVVFMSALEGTRVKKVLDLAIELYDESTKRIGTHELNEFLQEAQTAQMPSLWKGYPVKLFYISQVGNRPPTFVISANRPQAITESYRRYITNRMRERFGFRVPIRLAFKAKKQTRKKPGARRDPDGD